MTPKTWIGFLPQQCQCTVFIFIAVLLSATLFHYFWTRNRKPLAPAPVKSAVPPAVVSHVVPPIPFVPLADVTPCKPLLKAAPSAADPLLYKPSFDSGDVGIRRRWKAVKRKLPEQHTVSLNRFRSKRVQNDMRRVTIKNVPSVPNANTRRVQNDGRRVKTKNIPSVPIANSQQSHETRYLQPDSFTLETIVNADDPLRQNFFEKPSPAPEQDFFNPNHQLPVIDQTNNNTVAKSRAGDMNTDNALRANFFEPKAPSADQDFFHPNHMLPSPLTGKTKKSTERAVASAKTKV